MHSLDRYHNHVHLNEEASGNFRISFLYGMANLNTYLVNLIVYQFHNHLFILINTTTFFFIFTVSRRDGDKAKCLNFKLNLSLSIFQTLIKIDMLKIHCKKVQLLLMAHLFRIKIFKLNFNIFQILSLQKKHHE